MDKYYKILGLKNGDGLEELKKSRNELLKKYHPDFYLGNKKYAQEKTAKINEAYEKLKKIFEEKEEEKRLQKFVKDLGKSQSVKPNKNVVKSVIKAKKQPKTKSEKPEEKQTNKKLQKQETKKEKVIENTLIKDERKKEKNIEKRVLDITIFTLSIIAIVLLILFLTGVIR